MDQLNYSLTVRRIQMPYRLLLLFCLLIPVISSSALFGKEDNISQEDICSTTGEKMEPLFLSANDLTIATGNPSLQLMTKGSTSVPVWSMSGGTSGQSVVGLLAGLPKNCFAVQIAIIVTTSDKETSPMFEDVYRVHLTQMTNNAPFTDQSVIGTPVRTKLPMGAFHTREIVLESCCPVDPKFPLAIRIQREPNDPADTFTRPTGLAMIKITPINSIAKAQIVQDVKGYNSWPMIDAIGEKLVCVYSRGSGHTIGEESRAVYARTSTDKGKTWSSETIVANNKGGGEVAIAKGKDSKGAMLLWVRRLGRECNHDLYRTTDGVTFTYVTTPKLAVVPIQITDVFSIPTVGLMALWFAGNYNDEGPCHSWGTLISKDDGKSWIQQVIESDLVKSEWPTEPSAVWLGNGKLLAIARTEWSDSTTTRSQFQMISTDYGKSWKRFRTNIGDVLASTPSLVFDSKTGLVSNYYYHRGRGILRRRVADADHIFNNPLQWPDSEVIATGSSVTFDAGNANAAVIHNDHYLSFYSGKSPDTAIMLSITSAPKKQK